MNTHPAALVTVTLDQATTPVTNDNAICNFIVNAIDADVLETLDTAGAGATDPAVAGRSQLGGILLKTSYKPTLPGGLRSKTERPIGYLISLSTPPADIYNRHLANTTPDEAGTFRVDVFDLDNNTVYNTRHNIDGTTLSNALREIHDVETTFDFAAFTWNETAGYCHFCATYDCDGSWQNHI